MAMGGVKNEVWRFNAISIAKKYGFTPKNSTNGKNIGTNIINISVHSKGHPKRNIITVSYTHLTLPTICSV